MADRNDNKNSKKSDKNKEKHDDALNSATEAKQSEDAVEKKSFTPGITINSREDPEAFRERLKRQRMMSSSYVVNESKSISDQNGAIEMKEEIIVEETIEPRLEEEAPANYATAYPPLQTANLISSDDAFIQEFLAKYRYPWQALPHIKKFIIETSEKLDKNEYKEIFKGVFAHKSAIIFKTAYIQGPAIIGPEVQIRHCAFIRGSVYAGANSVLGNSCEFKNSILCENVETPHFNYVGDSILGKKSHLGAGAITSNVKSDRQKVHIKFNLNVIDTGLRKCGAFVGDHVEVGCNSVLNPGTIIGRNSRIYPLSSVRAYVQADSILKNDGKIIQIV